MVVKQCIPRSVYWKSSQIRVSFFAAILPAKCWHITLVKQHCSNLSSLTTNPQNECAPSEDSDQRGHPPSLWAASRQNHKMSVRPAKTQISVGIRPVFEQPNDKTTKWMCTQRRLRSAWASAQSDQMDEWVRILHPFNSISVISRWWKGEHERFCAIKRRLGLGRILPPAGSEPATPWSEVARVWSESSLCAYWVAKDP